jgi:hypothetical protein
MNKAFVREPDDSGAGHCPSCASLGVAVSRETWQAHVKTDGQCSLAESAFFCPFAKCEVVYFDMFDRRATVDSLRHGVYPKDPDAPLCGCFGLTHEDVQADVREGMVTRVRGLLAKAKTPEAHCLTMAANGQCCVPEVQRYYMKLRGTD